MRPVGTIARAGAVAARTAMRWSTKGITRSAMRGLSQSNAAGAIHLDAYPGDEGGFVACQVEGGIGDVECGREAPERDRREEFRTARLVDGAARELGRQAGVRVEDGVDAVDP